MTLEFTYLPMCDGDVCDNFCFELESGEEIFVKAENRLNAESYVEDNFDGVATYSGCFYDSIAEQYGYDTYDAYGIYD